MSNCVSYYIRTCFAMKSLGDQTVQSIGKQFGVSKSLESRHKSFYMLKFCRLNQRNHKTKNYQRELSHCGIYLQFTKNIVWPHIDFSFSSFRRVIAEKNWKKQKLKIFLIYLILQQSCKPYLLLFSSNKTFCFE